MTCEKCNWGEGIRLLLRHYLYMKETHDPHSETRKIRNIRIFIARHKYQMTYKDIARRADISRERVRQIDLRMQHVLRMKHGWEQEWLGR